MPNEVIQGSKQDFLPSYTYSKNFKIPELPTTKNLVVRRAMVEKLTGRFWSIWMSSYIEELNRVPSNTGKQYFPKKEDVVLMEWKDLGFRKGSTCLGIITEVHSRKINPTLRSKIRSVTVKYRKNNTQQFITKSVFKVAPLELTYLKDIYEDAGLAVT